jgi:hypothetical protein
MLPTRTGSDPPDLAGPQNFHARLFLILPFWLIGSFGHGAIAHRLLRPIIE